MSSIQQQRQIQNLNHVENGQQQQQQAPEEIPLQRLTSTERRAQETAERERARFLFDTYDRNHDNLLNVRELKNLIRNGACREMSRGLSHHVLKMNDHNGDGHLNFEEFFQLYQQNKWFINSLVDDYCHYIVPSPHREEGDQIDGAYERQMTCWPPPLTMIIFSIIEIIFFVIDVMHFKDDPNNTKKIGENTNGPAAQACIYNPYRRYEAWRFVTYMFVHVGIMHLVMNLLIQIFLGVALELVHHWWRVALVYLAGVAAGSMGTSLGNPNIFLAGASGGVYAIITAHVATILMNWKEMELAIVQLLVFLVFIFSDLGTSIYRHLTVKNDQIGYVAHLCGALAGFLIGIGVLRNLKVRRWEKIAWWIAILIYFALMGTGILIHIFYPQHFPNQQPYEVNYD